MKPSNCVECGRPVLELSGQFARLDSFFVEDEEPDPETVGEWHAICLAESPHAEAWFRAMYRNCVSVRGYRELC